LLCNNGAIVLYRSYDAFGTIRGSGGTSSSRLGYTGELQDTATGLVYLRARHYHPVLGRFLQRDSFAGFQQRPQSLHRYSYTENNPVNLIDPSGHVANQIIGGLLGFGLGSALYLINEQGQDGIDLGVDVTWDGWVPTCVNFNDWGDFMAAGLLGGAAGMLIATPGFGSMGASMAGNLLSDHWANVRNGQDFSWRRHSWNGAVGAFSGMLTGAIGEGPLSAHAAISIAAKGLVGAGFDTFGDYNTFFGLEPVTGHMMLTNLLFNLGGETFGEIMGRAGRFASNDQWTLEQADLWDGLMTQYWKLTEGPAKDLTNWMME
jgi:RHS repeat-associated protein